VRARGPTARGHSPAGTDAQDGGDRAKPRKRPHSRLSSNISMLTPRFFIEASSSRNKRGVRNCCRICSRPARPKAVCSRIYVSRCTTCSAHPSTEPIR
jgi:hypothetical protein